MKEFNSDYANVRYIEEDKAVFLTWKKAAYLENYREPAVFALELLRNNIGSNLVVDARNGFEDDKRDAEWGATYLIPEMAKTSCRFICFIMNKVNNIEEEMDMWTIEFGKYFAVIRAQNYNEAIHSMHDSIMASVVYSVKDGTREEFIQAVSEAQIPQYSRQEPGNIKYQISLSTENENDVYLMELWTNRTEQEKHKGTAHYSILTQLKKIYVEKVHISCYKVEEIQG